ncbi:unnamed protein product [Agarophyton chilense]
MPPKQSEEKNSLGKRKVLMFQIMSATSAFGTGIDSSFVRSVVHVGFSRSVMEYIQESGRAGRDGEPGRCVLLFNETFLKRYEQVIKYEPPESTNVGNSWDGKENDSRGISMNISQSIKPHFIRGNLENANESWKMQDAPCCYGCGLPLKFESSETHPSRDQIGSRCLVKACLKVCIAVWCNEDGRTWIIDEFKLSRDMDDNTLRSMYAFVTWLQEKNSERVGFNVMDMFPKLWVRMKGW